MVIKWDKKLVLTALSEISSVRDDALSNVKAILNRAQGTNFSTRYYDILCGSWLEYFLHLCFATWLEVQEDTNEYGYLDNELGLPIAETPEEFLFWSSECSEYRCAIYTVVARIHKECMPQASWVQSSKIKKIRINQGSRPSFKNKAFKKIASKSRGVIVCNSNYRCSELEFKRAVCLLRSIAEFDDLDYPIDLKVKVDVEWRLEQAIKSAGVGFKRIVETLLPLQIPIIYLEGYKECRQQMLGLDLKRPSAIYTANALHNHLTFLFLTAEWVEQGTRLLCHQHGGGYGIDREHAVEDFEARVSDRFYTWGWRCGHRNNIQPLSAPNFKLARGNKRYILLNCGNFPQQVFRIHFRPMPGRLETLIEDTVSFTEHLKNRERLLVRPYFQDYGSGMAEAIRSVSANIHFDEERPKSLVRFAQSRLVAHNYLDTSCLETLYLNIPTICFYDPEVYDFRGEAKSLIEQLETVGMIHRNGEDAALFVNRSFEHLDDWWQSDLVQDARRAFVQKYANFSESWVQEWKNEFEEVILSDTSI